MRHSSDEALLVPACLFGRFNDARKAANKFVTAFRKGKSLSEALGADMIEVTQGRPGLIVLDRQWSMISAEDPQFHVDQIWRRLEDAALKKDDRELFDRATDEALLYPWSFIGLAGGQYYRHVETAAGQIRFLEAALRHWPQLVSVGARYTQGFNHGEKLEQIPTRVSTCLARQGAPVEKLRPLTFERLKQLVEDLPGLQIRKLLDNGKIDEAFRMLEGHETITTLSLAEHFLSVGLNREICSFINSISTSEPHLIQRWLNRYAMRTSVG